MKKRIGRPKGSKNRPKSDNNGPTDQNVGKVYEAGWVDGWLKAIEQQERARAKEYLYLKGLTHGVE